MKCNLYANKGKSNNSQNKIQLEQKPCLFTHLRLVLKRHDASLSACCTCVL